MPLRLRYTSRSAEVGLRAWGWLLAVAGFAATTAMASPENPQTSPELIAAVQKTYSGVKSMRADFVQTIKSSATGMEVKEHGRIAVERPRKMRMESGPMGLPIKSVVVSDGATQWIYSADNKQVIVQKDLGGGAGIEQLIDDLSRLGELFDVTLAPDKTPPRPNHVVTLKPKQAGGLKSVELTLSRRQYVLQQLKLVDPMDTVTDMRFSLVQMNVDVPDIEFTFKAPPGVKVVNMAGP